MSEYEWEPVPEIRDAHFTMKRMGPASYLICDFCGRGIKRHIKHQGEGEMEGWTFYECKPGARELFKARKVP